MGVDQDAALSAALRDEREKLAAVRAERERLRREGDQEQAQRRADLVDAGARRLRHAVHQRLADAFADRLEAVAADDRLAAAEAERLRALSNLGVTAEGVRRWSAFGFDDAKAICVATEAARTVLPADRAEQLLAKGPNADLDLWLCEALGGMKAEAALWAAQRLTECDLLRLEAEVSGVIEHVLLYEPGDPTGAPAMPPGPPARWLGAARHLAGDRSAGFLAGWPELPLEVIDDLIDERVKLPGLGRARAASDDGHRYLSARLHPETLTEHDLLLLGWHEERGRRALLQGAEPPPECSERVHVLHRLASGEVKALLDLIRIDEPRDGPVVGLGRVSAGDAPEADLLRDTTLWPVVRALLNEERAPAHADVAQPFWRWWLLTEARAELLAGRYACAVDLAGRLVSVPDKAAAVEARTVRAAAFWLAGESTAARKDAATAARLTGSGTDGIAEGNDHVLQRASPGDWQVMPHVVLGMNEYVDDWNAAWRRSYSASRRSGDHARTVALNVAKVALQTAERIGDVRGGDFFRLPVRAKTFCPPVGLGLLRPAVVTLSRGTRPADAAFVRRLHAEAVEDVAARLLDHIAPPVAHATSGARTDG